MSSKLLLANLAIYFTSSTYLNLVWSNIEFQVFHFEPP